jgi:hypothetical protein
VSGLNEPPKLKAFISLPSYNAKGMPTPLKNRKIYIFITTLKSCVYTLLKKSVICLLAGVLKKSTKL